MLSIGVDCGTMYSVKLNEFTHLIDLQPADLKHFIASYVLRGNKVAIVETGPVCTVSNLLAGLQETNIELREIDYVLISHIHVDHAGGAGTLLQHLPNAKLLVHARGAPHMANPDRLWRQTKQILGSVAELYGGFEPVPQERIVVVGDGMTFDLGEGVELKVLETLGHASHHLSFYEKRSGAIFSGDAAGIYLDKFDVTIPTTPAPFHLGVALASIQKLIELSPRQLCYTHFGPANRAVERLQAYVDQLKLWAEIVQGGMRKGEDLNTIYREILERDDSTRVAADFIQSHQIFRRGIIIQNIQGFVKYFNKTSKFER